MGNQASAHFRGIEQPHPVYFPISSIELANATEAFDMPYQNPFRLIFRCLHQDRPVLTHTPEPTCQGGFSKFDEVENEHSSRWKNRRHASEESIDSAIGVVLIVVSERFSERNHGLAIRNPGLVEGGIDESGRGTPGPSDFEKVFGSIDPGHLESLVGQYLRQGSCAAACVDDPLDRYCGVLEKTHDLFGGAFCQRSKSRSVNVGQIVLI